MRMRNLIVVLTASRDASTKTARYDLLVLIPARIVPNPRPGEHVCSIRSVLSDRPAVSTVPAVLRGRRSKR